MEAIAQDPRFVECLQSLLEFIQEAPDLVQLQGLVSGLLKLDSKGVAGVPGDVPGKSPAVTGHWLAAEQAVARKLPKRLADRGLPFQVSFLMNDL